MARVTVIFGVVLIVVGVVYFFLTGSAHPTSLIPCAFGAVLVLCGVLANTEDPSRRMLWMHIAVTVGLLGFLVPAVRVIRALAATLPMTPAVHTAVEEQMIMAVVCLLFTGLCVRSFIAARRGRIATV